MWRILFALLASLCSYGAYANETFSLTFFGSLLDSNFQPSPWRGLVTVVTASGADGTYSNGDLLSLAFDATVAPSFETLTSFSINGDGGAAVTIAGGQITSVLGYYSTVPYIGPQWGPSISLNGSGIHYYDSEEYRGGVSYTLAFGDATLSPIPEPETYAMMIAGLGLLGTIARRRNAKQA